MTLQQVPLRQAGRVAVTLAVVLLAGFAGWQLWRSYMDEPWTRDGRIRAEVVGIAPDVSGLVEAVPVRDNQPVRRGEVLFRIDREPFEIAVRSAEANLASAIQSADVAEVEIEVARASLNKQRVDLALFVLLLGAIAALANRIAA